MADKEDKGQICPEGEALQDARDVEARLNIAIEIVKRVGLIEERSVFSIYDRLERREEARFSRLAEEALRIRMGKGRS